jgi:hypothetical protein
MSLPLPLILFFVVGAAFGLLTFSARHLYSEGSVDRNDVAADSLVARLGWLALCTMLWPVMVLARLYYLGSRKPASAKLMSQQPRNPQP